MHVVREYPSSTASKAAAASLGFYDGDDDGYDEDDDDDDDEEDDEYADVVCERCASGGDSDRLLLCDGATLL
jgi:hypothetical protein